MREACNAVFAGAEVDGAASKRPWSAAVAIPHCAHGDGVGISRWVREAWLTTEGIVFISGRSDGQDIHQRERGQLVSDAMRRHREIPVGEIAKGEIHCGNVVNRRIVDHPLQGLFNIREESGTGVAKDLEMNDVDSRSDAGQEGIAARENTRYM